MFIEQQKPKDYDCGYNLDLMIAALPRIEDEEDRREYASRIVELIKQSHKNWVDDEGNSPESWAHYYRLAEYNPSEYGITNPYETSGEDNA